MVGVITSTIITSLGAAFSAVTGVSHRKFSLIPGHYAPSGELVGSTLPPSLPPPSFHFTPSHVKKQKMDCFSLHYDSAQRC